jgi:hypothetical protein
MSTSVYELGYTGPEVDDAIAKIRALDIASLGCAVTILDSSKAAPYNLNFLRSPGTYQILFVYEASAPAGVADMSPVSVLVTRTNDGSTDGKLVQAIDVGDAEYYRVSVDGGLTWGDWVLEGGVANDDEAVEMTKDEMSQLFDNVMNDNATDSSDSSSGSTAAKAASRKSVAS